MIFGRAYIGWEGGAIDKKILALAGRGLTTATIHLHNRTKEAISIAAPRRRTISGRYVATEPAKAGAPPRKLSGHLRRSIAWQMFKLNTVGRVGTNLIYGRPLETWMGHSFLVYSMNKAKGEIATILRKTWDTATGVN